MIRIEKPEVCGWEPAIRGMRNPMNSWDKGDTDFSISGIQSIDGILVPTVGPNDADLMRRLCKGGPVHAKFRRMITVYVDITAPLYWWKEFDTYKVGTTANSCSTMHKIHSKELTLDDFSHDKLNDPNRAILKVYIDTINTDRELFLETASKNAWYQMIQMLPSSYNQKRTVELNYEVLVGLYRDRKNHKLDEWHRLCEWIERLPYSWIITGKENEDGET